jgi:hypothetical protein
MRLKKTRPRRPARLTKDLRCPRCGTIYAYDPEPLWVAGTNIPFHGGIDVGRPCGDMSSRYSTVPCPGRLEWYPKGA